MDQTYSAKIFEMTFGITEKHSVCISYVFIDYWVEASQKLLVSFSVLFKSYPLVGDLPISYANLTFLSYLDLVFALMVGETLSKTLFLHYCQNQ